MYNLKDIFLNIFLNLRNILHVFSLSATKRFQYGKCNVILFYFISFYLLNVKESSYFLSISTKISLISLFYINCVFQLPFSLSVRCGEMINVKFIINMRNKSFSLFLPYESVGEIVTLRSDKEIKWTVIALKPSSVENGENVSQCDL